MGVVWLVLASLREGGRENSSRYECGFDGKDKARASFPVMAFFHAVLFILFDVEFILLLRVFIRSSQTWLWGGIIAANFFLVLLVLAGVYK